MNNIPDHIQPKLVVLESSVKPNQIGLLDLVSQKIQESLTSFLGLLVAYSS